MVRSLSPALALLVVAAALSAAPSASAQPGPVAATPHFELHSELAPNLSDALIVAGNARGRGDAELFQSGSEQSCFAGLPPAERAAWHRAVDYYAEVVSPAGEFARPRTLLRLALLFDSTDWARGEERSFIELAALFRAAAAPAYERCRWPAQDADNRRWIEGALALLEAHGESVAEHLVRLYDSGWDQLPIHVDVVQTVSRAGASSIFVRPPPHHVLVGSAVAANQGTAALEVLFHEASHLLVGNRSPLREALAGAELASGARDDLWHAVLFYLTGEAVRRVVEESGEERYVPLVEALDLFGDLREAIAIAFEPRVDGERTLEDAARALGAALAP